MNTTSIDTQTTYRNTPTGIVATRGKREVHVIAKSVNATKAARALIAGQSFDSLFKSAAVGPRALGRNVRFVKVTA